MWAILSGIEGNLPAYEAVIADIKLQSRYIEALYIIGSKFVMYTRCRTVD